MQANRLSTLEMILDSEGSDLNTSPSEPGGASKYGISVDFMTDYHRSLGLPPATIANVSDLTSDIAMEIYNRMLLDKIRFDELPSGVDYRLADIATNLGLTGGARLLQVALGIWPVTGTYDDATVAAAGARDPIVLSGALGAAWLAKKFESTGWVKSGHGWTNRRNRVDADAVKMMGK